MKSVSSLRTVSGKILFDSVNVFLPLRENETKKDYEFIPWRVIPSTLPTPVARYFQDSPSTEAPEMLLFLQGH